MPTLAERAYVRGIRSPEDVPSMSPAAERAVLSWIRDDFAPVLHPYQWQAITSRARETYICAGRGSGKTYAGAAAVIAAVDEGHKDLVAVSSTFQSLMQYSVKGPSGIMNVPTAGERPRLMLGAVDPRLEWSNGARCLLLSAQRARGLRGANFSFGWLDEVTAWSYGREALDMLRLACRGRDDARMLATFTPAPDTRLAADLVLGTVQPDGSRKLPEGVEVIRASTFENRANLGEEVIRDLERRFPPGTRRHDLEILGEIVLDPDNPVFNRATLEAAMVKEADLPPSFDRVILSVDPSRSLYGAGDSCGALILAVAGETVFVLGDVTQRGAPGTWLHRLRGLYRGYGCSYAIYESNRLSPNLVALIHQEGGGIWHPTKAQGRKFVRLGPVLTLLEQGRLRLVDSEDGSEHLNDLIDELVSFDALEPKHQRDDRVDALSQGVSELLNPQFWRR